MTLKIAIVAGEASGDILGAGLIKALRTLYPDLSVSGIGGELMLAAGCQSLFKQDELAVMGILEPLKRLPRLIHIYRTLCRHFSENKPDVFIGIDSPDFNLRLAANLHGQGITTVHYVSPSVWAWRQYRIHHIKRVVDLMLTLLPFEAAFYEKHQMPVQFVGHPLAEKIPLQVDKTAARLALKLDAQGEVLALLPGSRKQELEQLGKAFLEAALICHQARPHLQFITSSINEARAEEWRRLHQEFAPTLPLHFFVGRSQEVMAAADAILVTSGTATLEAMLFKRPMVIAYRTSAFNFMLARLLVKTPFIGLPNLLAGEALVPELIQDQVQPETLARLLLEFLTSPEKTALLQQKFLALHHQLAQQADLQAAKAVSKLLENKRLI